MVKQVKRVTLVTNQTQGWRTIGGQKCYFRSRWEANYAHYLEWLKQRGNIHSWLHEPYTFWFEGIKRGVTSYKPDFQVFLMTGRHEWHEVKGFLDPKSRTKLARMIKYHPGEKVVLAGPEWFKKNSILKNIIPNWE